MANGDEFLLTLIGTLDEAKTKQNVQKALDKIGEQVKTPTIKSKGSKKNEPVLYNKEQLEKEKIAFLESTKDIDKQIHSMYQNAESIKIDKIFNDTGAVKKFKATITEMTGDVRTLNFEFAKFTDNTSGFRQVGGTEKTSISLKQQAESVQSSSVKIYNEEELRQQGTTFIQTTENMKQALADFYLSTAQKGHGINIEEIRNANKEIVGYTATIKNLDQTVAHYNLTRIQLEDGRSGFIETGSKINDKSLGDVYQKQLDTLRNVKAELIDIRTKYMRDGGLLGNPDNINKLNNELLKAEELFSKLNQQSNIGKNSIAQMTELQNITKAVKAQAEEYRKLEDEKAKQDQKDAERLSSQKYRLEDYQRKLKEIEQTFLNPLSAKSILNADGAQSIKNSFEGLKSAISTAQDLNGKNNTLFSQDFFREQDSQIKNLTQNIRILRGEMKATLDPDTSTAKVTQDVAVYREKLETLTLTMKRSGIYTDEFKQKMVGLTFQLSKVKTPKELDDFRSKLAILQEEAKRAGLNMQNFLANEQLGQKLKILSAQVTGYMAQNSRAAQQYTTAFSQLQAGIQNATSAEDLARLQNDFKLLQQNINNAGLAGKTFGDRIAAATKKFMMWTGMTSSVMYIMRTIRQMVTNVKELDSAMIFLRRVTDETETTYTKMFENATEKAKELNASVKDIINSTAEFAKLGYTSEQAEKLAEAATVYAKVGQLDITDATESIVSTLAGFKDLQVDDVWKIVDEFDNVGNKFAISSGGIGEALKRSAASLSESNNSLEESIALITTANTVVQDPDKVGRYCQR